MPEWYWFVYSVVIGGLLSFALWVISDCIRALNSTVAGGPGFPPIAPFLLGWLVFAALMLSSAND